MWENQISIAKIDFTIPTIRHICHYIQYNTITIVFQNIWIQWQIWPVLGTYCKTDFWSIESNQILVWQRDFTANLFRWEILIFVLYIFNSLGSKKGTIFYYNPRKVHSKALILLWNDHQFSIFWFLTKVSSKCQVVWKSKSQVR